MFGHMWGDSLKNRPQLFGTSNQSELPTCAGQNDDPKISLKAAVQVGGTPKTLGDDFPIDHGHFWASVSTCRGL